MSWIGTRHLAPLLTVAALLACPHASAVPTDPTAALPPDGFLDTWNRSGELETYPGERLFEHINGGAEIHLELGFVASGVQRYTDGAREISVEIFEMSDADAATGLFQRRYGGGLRIPRLAYRHAIDSHGIQLLLDRSVIVISSGRGEPELLLPMVLAAEHMAEMLPRGDHATLFDPLPIEGRIPHSERVARGPLTLRDAAPALEGDPLLLSGRGTAVAADYRGDRTVVVASYADREAASKVREHLLLTLAPGRPGHEKNGQALALDGGIRATVHLDGHRLTLTLAEDPDAPTP